MASSRALLRSCLRRLSLPRCAATVSFRQFSLLSVARPISTALYGSNCRIPTVTSNGWSRSYGDGPSITLQELEDRCQEILKLFDKVDASKVNLDARLIEDLGLDSLDVVEVVMAYEDDFGVEIPDEDAEKIKTVQDIVDFLKNALHVS